MWCQTSILTKSFLTILMEEVSKIIIAHDFLYENVSKFIVTDDFDKGAIEVHYHPLLGCRWYPSSLLLMIFMQVVSKYSTSHDLVKYTYFYKRNLTK